MCHARVRKVYPDQLPTGDVIFQPLVHAAQVAASKRRARRKRIDPLVLIVTISRLALLSQHRKRRRSNLVHDVKPHPSPTIGKRKLFLRVTHESRRTVRLRRRHRHRRRRPRRRRLVRHHQLTHSTPFRLPLFLLILPRRPLILPRRRRNRSRRHHPARRPHDRIQPRVQRLSIMTAQRPERRELLAILIRVVRVSRRALVRVRRERLPPVRLDEKVLHRSSASRLPGLERRAVRDERLRGRSRHVRARLPRASVVARRSSRVDVRSNRESRAVGRDARKHPRVRARAATRTVKPAVRAVLTAERDGAREAARRRRARATAARARGDARVARGVEDARATTRRERRDEGRGRGRSTGASIRARARARARARTTRAREEDAGDAVRVGGDARGGGRRRAGGLRTGSGRYGTEED